MKGHACLRQGSSILLFALALLAPSAAADFTYAFTDQAPDGAYSLRVPVQAAGEGELRIAFDGRDTGGSSSVHLVKGTVALYQEKPGGAERVGEPRPAELTGNSEVTLQRRPGRVRVICSGRVVLDRAWPEPPGGRVAVGGSGGVVPGQPILQPIAEEPSLRDDFARLEDAMDEWQTTGGSFRNTMVQAPGADAARSANPFSLDVHTYTEALATTGYWFWDAYRASVSVKPRAVASIGLCAYVQDSADYVALRWDAGEENRPGARRLVLVRHGREEILAQAPGGFAPNEWYKLELRVTPGRVEALIDRDHSLAADTPAFGQGGIGLWVRRGEALFDDALVTRPEGPAIEVPDINPTFLADRVMTSEGLFQPRGFWLEGSKPGEYWHCGRFFDDATAVLPVSLINAKGLGVLLRSDAANTVTGYALQARTVEGRVRLALARNGTPVAAGALALTDRQRAGGGDTDLLPPLVVTVEGGQVTASCGAEKALSYTDPQPLRGQWVALLDAPANGPDCVAVTSHHFQDYPFDSGPTDWYAGKGTWDVTTRWACQPGWTFFGGTGDENPILWTKHSLKGDQVLEFYAALQFQSVQGGYTHPSDINATLCGDGRGLGSGYSFIYAGWDNKKSAILRNGKVVAETTEAVFRNPTPGNPAFHHAWFRVRAEKLGNVVRFSVDGEPILKYTDPDPLEGGRVGLWTFHNGLMLGRVRLWYAKEEPAGVVRVPEPRPTRTAPVARSPQAGEILNTFETDVGEWQKVSTAPRTLVELDSTTAAAGGKQSLRVTNGDDGGAFAVYASTTPFQIGEWPLLSFDYRFDPAVRLNLYLYINGGWQAVRLTGEQLPWDGVTVVGEVPGIKADGTWHHAEVNLLALLHRAYPQFKLLRTSYVALAAPRESYVSCGIGGNGRGTRYWIDNFRIGPLR